MHMWAPGGAANALHELTPRIVLKNKCVQLFVCSMREPTGIVPNSMAMTRM